MNPQAWFAVGALCLWSAADWCRTHMEAGTKASVLVVSQAGRDQAMLRLIREARTSVYLRTERLTLVPASNELVLAIQRKASVTVDLPLGPGCDAEGARLPRLLMEQGAVVTFRSDPGANDRGTFLVVDGNQFLYSATPLTLSMPGAQVSYVIGKLSK
jgi:hypothetical protein